MKVRLLLFTATFTFAVGLGVTRWVLAFDPSTSVMLATVLSAVGVSAILLASRKRGASRPVRRSLRYLTVAGLGLALLGAFLWTSAESWTASLDVVAFAGAAACLGGAVFGFLRLQET